MSIIGEMFEDEVYELQTKIKNLELELEVVKRQSNTYAKRLCSLGEDDNIIWFASNKN